MSMTFAIPKSFRLVKTLVKDWRPLFQGAFWGLIFAGIILLLDIPDNREIDVDEYRWLSEQVESYPEIKRLVFERLEDDGYISNWDLWKLRKTIRQHARETLLEKVHPEQLP